MRPFNQLKVNQVVEEAAAGFYHRFLLSVEVVLYVIL